MAKITDKEYKELWEEHKESFSGLSVNKKESFAEKKKRIKHLEANPEQWFKYYFKNYYTSEPANFHLKATKRVLTHPEWFDVRAWSRELSKSSRSMMEVIYLAMTGKKKNVLLVSNSKENAEELLLPFKSCFEFNARLLSDYGIQKTFGKWKDGKFKIKKGCSFRAIGWGQSPRGSKNDNFRPDVILIDDIDTDEECRNEDIQLKKINWVEQALIGTRSISNPLLIIVNGNIIHNDCTVLKLAERADYFEVINIRDENGKSTWAEKNTEEMIDRVLSIISHASQQKEYFNNPMDETQTFKNLADKEVPNLSECILLIYGDPSTSNTDRGNKNNKVVHLLALDLKNMTDLHIVKTFMDIPTNAKFIDAYFELYRYAKQFKDDVFVYIENNSLQKPFYEQVFLPLIYQKVAEYGLFLPITPDERKKGEKYSRIEARLEPLDRLGHLSFNQAEANNKNMQTLKAQFKAFSGKLKKVDGLDAVEGGAGILQEKAAYYNTQSIEVIKKRRVTKI
jgi:hypothetical protein